jgi:hypothetical protein
MVLVENMKEQKVSWRAGNIIHAEISENVLSCTFDRQSTRFQIVLTMVDDEYVVSVPNFFFSMRTHNPCDIAYKMIERNVMAPVDAESVEMAINWLMSQQQNEQQIEI